MSPWMPCVTFGLSHRQWEQAIHSAGPPPTTQLPSCVQGLAFTGLTYPHNIPREATAQRGQGNCSGSPSCGRQD